MDDALVARWREGDPTATTAVRNGIRTVAERMLSHPTLRAVGSAKARRVADDEVQRREITADIAREVMVRGGASAADVTAVTIMVSARKVVELLRFERPFTGETHLPPQVAVSFALAPDSLPKPSQDAASKHVEECTGCSEDVRVVGSVVRSTPQQEVAIAKGAHRNLQAAEPPSRVGPSSSELLDGLEVDEEAPEEPRPRPEPRRKPPSRKKPAEKLNPGEKTMAQAMFPVVVLSGILAIYGWWSANNAKAERYDKRMAVARLAIRPVPEVPPGLEELREYDQIQLAVEGEDCEQIADLAGAARVGVEGPRLTSLYGLEVAAHICAGDGAAAMQTLDAAVDAEHKPAEYLWYRAQAQLLYGDTKDGVETLRDVQRTIRSRAAQADGQLSSIRRVWPEL